MLAGVVFGAIFCLAIYVMMKLTPIFSLVCYIAIGAGTYFVARQVILATGAGPYAYGNAYFLSTLVFAILSGFAVANCFGVNLETTLPALRDNKTLNRSDQR